MFRTSLQQIKNKGDVFNVFGDADDPEFTIFFSNRGCTCFTGAHKYLLAVRNFCWSINPSTNTKKDVKCLLSPEKKTFKREGVIKILLPKLFVWKGASGTKSLKNIYTLYSAHSSQRSRHCTRKTGTERVYYYVYRKPLSWVFTLRTKMFSVLCHKSKNWCRFWNSFEKNQDHNCA